MSAGTGTQSAARLAALAEGFRGRRCLIIGDALLDVFEGGRATRLAPDAPVPVVTGVSTTSHPGGAANVAANLAALGARVVLLSAVGDDAAGEELLEQLAEAGVETADVLREPGRATVVKRRIVADGVVLARLDSGDGGPLENATAEKLARKAARLARDAEVVVVSDYSGVVVNGNLADSLDEARHGCVVLDSKTPLRLRWRDLAAATPNHLEAQEALGLPTVETDPKLVDAGEIGEALRRELGARVLALTLAGEGVAVLDGAGVTRVEGCPVASPDVNGAGDSFLAAFSLALAGGATPRDAARLGVEAATVAVSRPGTVPVSREDLLRRLPAEPAGDGGDLPGSSLEAKLARVRRSGGRVVFVAGSFDPPSREDLRSLREARALGDLLVVGLRSDDHARRQETSPFLPEGDRAKLLEALPFVDHVVPFDGDPEIVARRIGPDLYVTDDAPRGPLAGLSDRSGDTKPATNGSMEPSAEVGR